VPRRVGAPGEPGADGSHRVVHEARGGLAVQQDRVSVQCPRGDVVQQPVQGFFQVLFQARRDIDGFSLLGAEMARAILNRLRFPKKQVDEIVACVLHHMQFKDVKQMRKATLRRLLLRDTFPLELALHRLDCLGSHGDLSHYEFLVEQVQELNKKPAIRPPLLTGGDLIKLGMKPGPAMGALLAEIREKQLQDELKTPSQAKTWVKMKMKETGGKPPKGTA